ncbi:MAG: CARDB domain-containing protein [Candidatus Micrarchaeaceae archaeon]
MKMKSMIWIIPVLVALAPQMAIAQVTGSASGALSLVNVGIYPQPVMSGSNATVTFQLYNSYSGNLNNVNLQLTAQSPLINVSPAYTFLINAIGTGLYGGIGYNSFKYTFHVPSTTPSGEYTIDVVASYETSQSEGTTSINVPAQSIMPISFYVYGVPNIGLSASPAQIIPGQDFVLQVGAENGGSGLAQNVNVTLHSSSAFAVVGPMSFNLGNMPASGIGQFSAMLQPSQNITSGTYPVNTTISYTNQFGAVVEKNESIMLNVLVEKPNIIATVMSAMPQNLYAGSNQTLQILVENTGNGLARNVSVDFYNTSALNLGSVSSFYMSQLPAGSSQTVQLYISANKGLNKSSYSLPAAIKYESSNYQNGTTKLIYIPVSLQGTAAFNITAEYGTLLPGATYVPVTFHIVNTGNEEAQQISFSLQTVYPITPVTPNVYISSIAPGQGINATFYVSIDSQSRSGSYPVTIYEQWRQPNGNTNQEFSASQNYFASVVQSSGNYSDAIAEVVVIVVIVALFAYYASRKARARGKSQKR